MADIPRAGAIRGTTMRWAWTEGSSGFTLTVVLNFATRQLVGVASGGKDWFPLRGTFEVVG